MSKQSLSSSIRGWRGRQTAAASTYRSKEETAATATNAATRIAIEVATYRGKSSND
jgi:hypothetical protein